MTAVYQAQWSTALRVRAQPSEYRGKGGVEMANTWPPSDVLVDAVEGYLCEAFPRATVKPAVSEQRPRAVQFRVELPGGEPHYHVYIPGQFFEDYPDPTAIARELREGKVAETMVAQGPRSVTTVFGKER